jgi:hypothetical protein
LEFTKGGSKQQILAARVPRASDPCQHGTGSFRTYEEIMGVLVDVASWLEGKSIGVSSNCFFSRRYFCRLSRFLVFSRSWNCFEHFQICKAHSDCTDTQETSNKGHQKNFVCFSSAMKIVQGDCSSSCQKRFVDAGSNAVSLATTRGDGLEHQSAQKCP